MRYLIGFEFLHFTEELYFTALAEFRLNAVFKADKEHLHHKIMKRGFSQKQAVLILYGLSATFGMFAIILLDSGLWKALSFALMVIAIVAIGYKDTLKIGDISNETDKTK